MGKKAKKVAAEPKPAAPKRPLTPQRLTAELRQKFGLEAALLMGEHGGSAVRSVCPTGITVLDRWVLGVGGMPYGRIMELYGNEGGGKTTVMNKLLAGVQKDGGIAVLCETEHKYDPAWAKLHGVDLDQLVLLQPTHLEGALAEIEATVSKANGPMLIALDSVAGIGTKAEVDEGVTGAAAMGEQGRVWSHALRVLVPLVSKHQVALVLVNQVRMKIGVMYGHPETTPGGLAIKHHCSIRLNVFHGKKDGDTARFLGVQAYKNQCAPPFRKGVLKLDFHEGFKDRWAVLNHAKEMGCVTDGCKSFKEAAKALGWDDLLTGGKDGEEEGTGGAAPAPGGAAAAAGAE